VRSWPEESVPTAPVAQDLDELLAEGRWGDTGAALRLLESALPDLEHAGDADSLLLGLYGRVQLQRLTGVPVADVVVACDTLERAAVERRCPVFAATACALRANLRMESGDVGAAMADLARVDLDRLGDAVDGAAGARLLDVLATAYARLRLVERLDDIRGRLDDLAGLLPPVARATHWAGWATELAGRAMEPLASGTGEPDLRLLERAVAVADRARGLGGDVLPPRLRRTVDGVRALAAAYRGRPSEALRLLGQDAFGAPSDLAPLDRQVVRLAAMHAHALVGSIATARSLDDAGHDGSAALPHLVLEVCRARERLWLESHAGGDVVPVLHRLTDLLVRLGWQGMDLVTDTARQALEHQALRTESRTDPLTGVGNRRALDEDLRQILRFTPLPMSLVLADVDDFKGVNDRFTHVVGDEVLRRVAGSLSAQLRVGDRLLRYGGDEFVVLLPRTGDQEAHQVAGRMADAIAAMPWTDLAEGLDVRITTGCAALWSLTGRRPERDAETLFRRADEALLEAKRQRPDGSLPGNPWRASGRRVALREAPGPTLAPPDREPPREERLVVDLTVHESDPWDAPPSPAGGVPATRSTFSRRSEDGRQTSPERGGVLTAPRGLTLPAGAPTPPLGQAALVADLLDTAETMDEAVSHVTAPGVPVITGALPLLPPRHGRRALGPPEEDDDPLATPSDLPPVRTARRPAVIDLDHSPGRRAARRQD
jgi:diguanylate cyclase (GGDEF)-like protein